MPEVKVVRALYKSLLDQQAKEHSHTAILALLDQAAVEFKKAEDDLLVSWGAVRQAELNLDAALDGLLPSEEAEFLFAEIARLSGNPGKVPHS